MAKLADAADLKSAGRKAVGVQVPLWAPKLNLIPPQPRLDASGSAIIVKFIVFGWDSRATPSATGYSCCRTSAGSVLRARRAGA
jgi:hypothetical protein